MSFAGSRLGVGVIGAGRVGPVLARALRAVGHSVTGISGGQGDAERLDAMLPGVPLLNPEEILRRSELVLFAVPGKELPALVAGLSATGAWQPGQLAIHTCAGHGTAVFSSALAAGVIPLAIHPVMSFTGTSIDIERLSGISWAITASAPVMPIAEALVLELGGEGFPLGEREREGYAVALERLRDGVGKLFGEGVAALAAAGVAGSDRIVAGALRSAIGAGAS